MIWYADLQERLPALENGLRRLVDSADGDFEDDTLAVPTWVRKGMEELGAARRYLGRALSEWPTDLLQRLRDFALNVAIAGLPDGDLSDLVGREATLHEAFAWEWATTAAQLGSNDAELFVLILAARAKPSQYGPFLREAFLRQKGEIPWRLPLPSNKISALPEKRRRLFVLEIGLHASTRLPKDEELTRSVAEVCKHYAQKVGDIPMELFPLKEMLDRILATSEKQDDRLHKILLRSMTPSNKSEERQALARFRPLMRPLPLTVWPEDRSWAQCLREEFPWMETVIAAVERQQALARSVGINALRVRPMLLVGPAGTGKTRFLRRLGEVLSVPTIFLPLAGSGDNMTLKGLARGWSNARPSYLVEAMFERKCPNPLVVLDEIEKIALGRNNGRVWETLLILLEPSSNGIVLDEYLMGQVDYSTVSFVATANSVTDLPAPLRSRLDIFEVSYPKGVDFYRIMGNVVQDIAKELGVNKRALPALDAEVQEELRRQFVRDPRSLRGLRRLVSRLLEVQAMAEWSAREDPRLWQ